MATLTYWEEQRTAVSARWQQAQADWAAAKVGSGKLRKKKIMNELEQELKRIDGNIEEAAKALAFQTLATQGQNGYVDMRAATGKAVTDIVASAGTATKDILLASKGMGGKTENIDRKPLFTDNPLAGSGGAGGLIPDGIIPNMGDMFSGKNKMYLIGGAALLIFLMFRKK